MEHVGFLVWFSNYNSIRPSIGEKRMNKCLLRCCGIFPSTWKHSRILSYHLERALLLKMDLACCTSGPMSPYACSGGFWHVEGSVVPLGSVSDSKRWRGWRRSGTTACGRMHAIVAPGWPQDVSPQCDWPQHMSGRATDSLSSSSTEQAIWAASTGPTRAVKHGTKGSVTITCPTVPLQL